MKTNIIFLMLLLVAALCSCNSDERFGSETLQPDSGAIELTVNAHNFVTDGAPDTRATDNGKETTFEKDDRVGVIILDGSSNIVYNNIPYKYNGSQWVFDSGNNESKSQCYYDNKAGSLTYIVYYPYSSVADGAKSESDLKAQFSPKPIQQSKEAYRASDLMVWASSFDTPLKTLTAELRHAYASVSLSPKVKYTLNDDKSTVISYVTSRLSDVNLTISDKVYSPYRAEDGSFRCILPVGFSVGDVRYFYTFDGKTYGGTFNIASVAANTRYTSTQQIDAGIYNFDKVQVGDFYCMNSSDEGYLIPSDAVTLPTDANPVGIVYWVGNPANATDGDPLLGTDHSNCTHGLVVALQDAGGNSLWSSNYEDITSNWLSQQTDTPYGISSLKEQNKMQGYANTKALKGYNAAKGDESNLRALPIDLIGTYATTHSAPVNSSNWYWPSVMELKYMCWGKNNSSGVAGRNMLNTQLGKLGIASLQSPYYWSSTERDYNYAWSVDFNRGDVYGNLKSSRWYGVRAVLAF